MGIGAYGFGLASARWGLLVLSEGDCAGRILSAEEVRQGLGSGWGFLRSLWVCL